MITNHDEALNLVIAILRDGTRDDRYVKRDENGNVYSTEDAGEGAVYVASPSDLTEENEGYLAREILEQV